MSKFPAGQTNLVSTPVKLKYAMGGLAEGFAMVSFNAFSFIVYTVGFGLPGTLVGLAVFLSLAIDAITDPIIGYLSDGWRSSLGRRHPFIFVAAIPVGLSVFCVFVPPASLLENSSVVWSIFGYEAIREQWLLAGWLFLFGALLKLFITCYTLPHVALGSELSDDYLERTRIFRYNTIFVFCGSSALVWAFYNVFFPAGPQPGMQASLFAGSLAVVSAVVIFLTAYLTRDQIPRLPKATRQQLEGSKGFFRECVSVFGNRNYLMLFLGLLSLAPMLGIRETIGANMSLFYWEFPPRLIGYLPIFTISAILLSMALVEKLNRMFEKSGTMRLAVLLAAIAACGPVLARSLGLMPANGSMSLFAIVGLAHGLYIGSISILTTTVYSAIGDVADEEQVRTSRRQEAVLYALRTFFGKLSVGAGHVLAGIAIDVINFPPGAIVGQVPSAVIFKLGLVDGPLASIPVIFAIYFYGLYKLDRSRAKEVARLLSQRSTVDSIHDRPVPSPEIRKEERLA